MKQLLRAILLSVIGLWGCEFSCGAYNLKTLTSKEGLTNSSILSFGQVENKLMLIGTCDGVNCYDGMRIFPLLFVKGQQPFGNIIQNIIVDKDDRGWILTNHGLGVIQRTKEACNLTYFQSARGIRLNTERRVVALQDSALYYHTGEDTLFVRLPLSGGDQADQVRDFVMAENYFYLFKNDGIVRYSLQRKGSDYTLGQRDVLSREPLHVATYDDGHEFVVDGGGTLWTMDFATGRMTSLANLREDINERGTIGSIKSLNDRLFVCFSASGVLMLEKQGTTYEKRDLGLQVGVTASYKDQDNNIMWLGTDGQGVLMFLDETETRRSLTSDVLRLRQFKPVRAILADGDGTLWMGTKGDGLLKIPHFDLNDIGNNTGRMFWRRESSGLAGNSVFALAKSRKLDGFWIATNGGMSFRNSQQKTIVPVTSEIPVEWVSAVCERGDTLWLATQGMGIYRAIISGTADSPRLVNMRQYVLDGGRKASNYFFSMSTNASGPLYFGNRGKGLYVLHDDILKWVKPEVELDYSIGLQDIFAVLPTHDGLWIGTGCGLSFRSNDGHREFYNTQNGMPNNMIHALAEDGEGNVWASTNRGMVRFLKGTRAMRIYNESDNMEVNEYADGASFSQGNTVYFGGINGVSIIKSDVAKTVSKSPNTLEFTGLSINGVPSNINEYLRLDDGEQTLIVNYDQNTLKLNVANFDFKASGNYNFFYSFSKDGSWISNGSSGEINLTRLANGSHTLYVKYVNRLTAEESDIYQLHIRITPPWYLSWWAKLLYALLIAAVLYVAYRRWYRHRMMLNQIQKTRQEQAQRDEVFEQKMHFLTNLVHELNTPLTLVYGPCERILAHTGTDNFVRKYVRMIQGNMGRLNYLIKEIIDFRRMSTGSEELQIHAVAVGEWMDEMAGAFRELADSNHVNYELDIDRDLVWNLDERALLRIGTNLISNAFKYSKSGATIRVQLQRSDDNQMLFSVYNTGKGIAEEDRQRIFDYYSVLENVDESSMPGLTSRNGLGMAICHNAVIRLGGTIDIDSVVNEYARFIVKIPQHELPEGVSTEPVRPAYEESLEAAQSPLDIMPAVDTPSSAKTEEDVKPHRKREPRAHREDLPTILVIDDNIDILHLLEDTLSDDYNVLTAQSGEQGLEVLKQLMPDLIVTDIMMPGMDGLELTQQLKQNKHTMHIPLVILSARRSNEELVEGLESGADAYVSKPFSTQYLLATVARLLENRKVLKEYYNTSASAFTYQDGKLMTGEERAFRDQVVAVINKHITNADFTPDDLAREMAISQRNLYRKFSDAGLPTPKEYIKTFKIEHAARQLNTTNLTIQEIIYSSGFNTRSQFYTEFRKHYGITPKEYREQRRVRDDSLE